jgi:hypothetical protein
MRLVRARAKIGTRRLLINVKRRHLDCLEVKGYLDPDKRGERAAEIEAVECYLANTLILPD